MEVTDLRLAEIELWKQQHIDDADVLHLDAAYLSVLAFLTAPLPYFCKSCDRDVRKIHPDFRGRKMNGRMAHLELDKETGATVLVEE